MMRFTLEIPDRWSSHDASELARFLDDISDQLWGQVQEMRLQEEKARLQLRLPLPSPFEAP